MIFREIDIGNCRGVRFKRMPLPALAIAGLAAGGASVFNKGLDFFSTGLANDSSLSNSKELMHDQAEYQHQANLRAMSDKRQSLERAGINLNAENGFQPATAMPTASLQALKSDAPLFDYNALNAGTNALVGSAQAGNLNRGNKLFDATFEAQVDKIFADTKNAQSQADISAIIADNQQKMINADINEKDANSGLALENTALAAATTNKMSVEVDKLRHEIEEIDSRTDLNKTLKKKAIADIALSYASAKYQKSLSLYTDKQSKKYDSYIQSVIDVNNAGKFKAFADAGLSTWQVVKIFADLPYYAGKLSRSRYDDFCKNLGIPKEYADKAWSMAARGTKYHTTSSGAPATPTLTGE